MPKLSRFSVIVAVDAADGIGKNNEIFPQSDTKFFREKTLESIGASTYGRNALIFGRKTAEGILEATGGVPLADRTNIVISSNPGFQDLYNGIKVMGSLLEALAYCANSSYETVWVAGGQDIYNEAIYNFMYLCDQVIITKFNKSYDCDRFFPTDEVIKNSTHDKAFVQRTSTFVRTFHIINPTVHPEMCYVNALKEIIDHGERKPNRTGTDTLSIFGGITLSYDISDRLPVFTTRKIAWLNAFKELLFFISGSTDTNRLTENGCKYWEGNTNREFLDKRGLTEYKEGDMGPMYGYMWRSCGATDTYEGCDVDYRGKGIDQLAKLIETIKEDPHSRRLILTNYDPNIVDQCVLMPCHIMFQLNVSGDGKYLDGMLFQRSGDMILGVPTNTICYSTLIYMIAHLTGLKPRRFIHSIGDAHIYTNHLAGARRVIDNDPHPWPKLIFRNPLSLNNIDDFTLASLVLTDYTSNNHIAFDMAV